MGASADQREDVAFYKSVAKELEKEWKRLKAMTQEPEEKRREEEGEHWFDISDDPRGEFKKIKDLLKRYKKYDIWSINQGPHGIDERNIILDVDLYPEASPDATYGEGAVKVDKEWVRELQGLVRRALEKW